MRKAGIDKDVARTIVGHKTDNMARRYPIYDAGREGSGADSTSGLFERRRKQKGRAEKAGSYAFRRPGNVSARFHDLRHTLITKLAESGAGDETITGIAGHGSRRMLSRYTHIRTEAKRKALESILRPVEGIPVETAVESLDRL